MKESACHFPTYPPSVMLLEHHAFVLPEYLFIRINENRVLVLAVVEDWILFVFRSLLVLRFFSFARGFCAFLDFGAGFSFSMRVCPRLVGSCFSNRVTLLRFG